jgi:nucleoside-diphosphate-sugar epimerase
VSEPDLVTGATGFIGSHLVHRLLASGRGVRVLCRARSLGKLSPQVRGRVEVILGDLTDRASLERATKGALRVFHAAGQVSDWGPVATFAGANVEGTRWLAEAAHAAGAKRFVHLSSFVVFGVPSPPEMDDDSPYGSGSDPYTRTKIEGEKTVLAFHRDTGAPVVVLRPTVVYGPGSTWLEEPKAMMKRGRFFLIGAGRGTCHPCYVENLCDALLLAAEHPRAVGRAFLVCDDQPISFSDYFAALASLAGTPPPRRSIPTSVARALALAMESAARLRRTSGRPLLTRTAVDLVTTESRLSIWRIREELGFAPRWSFEEAMKEMAGGAR